MNRTTHTTPQQVRVSETLDVQAVERELSRLWMESASDEAQESAVMRARVLNLLVYVSSEEALQSVNELLSEVTAAHPCRAIVMVAEREGSDRDIEMFVSAHCQTSESTAEVMNLCCEQVTLKASGRYCVELPSAATPLVVPDLSIFLWWHDRPRLNDEVFRKLSHASDRVILDSADFTDAYADLLALNSLLQHEREAHTGISDLNWARLTSWRGLLANFYDVHEYRAALERINRVRIQYVAPEGQTRVIAPKALILAGWLASRLGWSVMPEQPEGNDDGARSVRMQRDGHEINIEFERVERGEMMHGWVARVELSEGSDSASTFTVARSRDGRYLETQSLSGTETRASRLLTGGDKSEAELLGRELEILTHDRIYEEAVASAVLMLKKLSPQLP